ncbi:MAG: nucleotidyltransferase family protein [Chloroflexi bacterium]|nr:nucleotidyltransferase family protein [Chloroflexota bacterium]
MPFAYHKKLANEIRPEAEVLFRCARTYIDAETAHRIETLVREDLDWGYLLRAAHRHRMVSLVHWQLNATCAEAVPKDILDRLRDRFRQTNKRNLLLASELRRILKLFEAEGIPVVPFKGPVLAVAVYGNLALRQFDDLDMLIQRQDALRAKDLLISQRYRPQYKLNRAQEASYMQTECEFSFLHENGVFQVEIHWDFLPHYFSMQFDTEGIWERVERASLGGLEVPTLAPEDLLLFLCAHGSKHYWERLSWICDVAELIRARPDLRWEAVIEQARISGGERMLLVGLSLANDLLGTMLPAYVLERMQADSAVKSLSARVRGRLQRDIQREPNTWERKLLFTNIRIFNLSVRERPLDKIRYYLRMALTPTVQETMAFPLPLPRFLYTLYYLLRPVRFVEKHGRRVWSHFSRSANRTITLRGEG